MPPVFRAISIPSFKWLEAYEQVFGLLQFRALHSAEQQQAYEVDIKADSAEYSIHHARVRAARHRSTGQAVEMKRLHGVNSRSQAAEI